MRKFRVAALILVAVVMILTSCSQDAAAGLGKAMKWMGGNVYGIKPDLRRPNAAIATVDSIATDKDSLLNTALASELIESISGFLGSVQSVDSFISNLDAAVSTPVSVFRDAVVDLKITAASINSNNAHVERLRTAFMEVITSLEGFCAEEGGTKVLTRRDVVTFSLMNSLVQKLSESVEDRTYEEKEKEIAESANSVLSVLKLSTNYSKLNIVGDIDIVGLISSNSEGESVDRATDNNTFILVFGKTLGKLATFVSEDYRFSLVKYNRLHVESKSLRFCYELSMIPYIKSSGEATIFEGIAEADIDYGLTLDDLVMYLISSFSRLMDSKNSIWTTFLGNYLNENNISALCDMQNKVQDLQNPIQVLRDTQLDEIAAALGIEAEEGKEPKDVLKSYIEIVYDFSKRAGKDKDSSLWDFIRALKGKTKEEMSDEEAKQVISDFLIEKVADALGTFDEIKNDAKYFAGTCLGILSDAGFDTFFREILELFKRRN